MLAEGAAVTLRDDDATACEVVAGVQSLELHPSDVSAKVLGDRNLLELILTHLERWECAGRASGVCHLWRRAVIESPHHWRHVVIVPTGRVKPSARTMRDPVKCLPISREHDFIRHVHQGALPVLPDELGRRWTIRRRVRCMGPCGSIRRGEKYKDEAKGGDWVETLVVLPKELHTAGPPQFVVDVPAVERALSNCLNVRSIYLDLTDWEKRIFPKGARSASKPRYAARSRGTCKSHRVWRDVTRQVASAMQCGLPFFRAGPSITGSKIRPQRSSTWKSLGCTAGKE